MSASQSVDEAFEAMAQTALRVKAERDIALTALYRIVNDPIFDTDTQRLFRARSYARMAIDEIAGAA